MICKESTHNDLEGIAFCHIKAFPKSLSSKLGLKYVTRMISFYLEDNRGVLFHIEDGDEIAGYFGGLMTKGSGQHGSATSMTQHTFKILLFSLIFRPWLLFNQEIRTNIPLIIKNISLRFLRSSSTKKYPKPIAESDFTPSMGLVVIGVTPEYQGKGFGSALLEEFEAKARREGFKKITLSVHKDNHQAINAYRRNGWIVGSENNSVLYMFKEL